MAGEIGYARGLDEIFPRLLGADRVHHERRVGPAGVVHVRSPSILRWIRAVDVGSELSRADPDAPAPDHGAGRAHLEPMPLRAVRSAERSRVDDCVALREPGRVCRTLDRRGLAGTERRRATKVWRLRDSDAASGHQTN